jgi:hypothetical protein
MGDVSVVSAYYLCENKPYTILVASVLYTTANCYSLRKPENIFNITLDYRKEIGGFYIFIRVKYS